MTLIPNGSTPSAEPQGRNPEQTTGVAVGGVSATIPDDVLRAARMARRLREIMEYDAHAGHLRWRPRRDPPEWNARYAGTIVGTPTAYGYRQVQVEGKLHLEHRLIWLFHTGKWPVALIDHINGDRSDNRLQNLREADDCQNAFNAALSVRNTSGFKGITRLPSGRWHARIRCRGGKRTIGTFDTKEDAAAAYEVAATRLHGEFARIE